MNAVIDTGGGLRGIYGAGIFDALTDRGVNFDLAIGVSAGSANIASFLARQRGRNYLFYHEYPFRKEYMGVSCLRKNREYISLDYVYSTLTDSGGENPIDYDTMMSSETEYTIVATDAVTGEPVYFGKEDIIKDDYAVFKASCAIPVVCRKRPAGGRLCYDGGISDPVPVKYAEKKGADKTVVILSRPLFPEPSFISDKTAAAVIALRQPEIAKALIRRKETYFSSLRLAVKLQREGRCLIVAPADITGLGTVKRDREALDRLYREGIKDSEKIIKFLEKGE